MGSGLLFPSPSNDPPIWKDMDASSREAFGLPSVRSFSIFERRGWRRSSYNSTGNRGIYRHFRQRVRLSFSTNGSTTATKKLPLLLIRIWTLDSTKLLLCPATYFQLPQPSSSHASPPSASSPASTSTDIKRKASGIALQVLIFWKF